MAGGFLNLALRLTAVLATALCAETPAASPPFQNENDYFVRVWTVEDGLAENTVSAVLQTKDGYLWVGSYVGLARFDGLKFTVFNHGNVPELHDNAVTSLYEGEDGTLWIGHETGEVTRFKEGKFEAVKIPGKIELGKIVGITSDETDAIWVMSEGGLLARVGDGLSISPLPGASTNLVALTRSPKGDVWIAQGGRICALSAGHLRILESVVQSPNGSLQGLGASRDGGLWVATDSRIRKWKDGQWVSDLGTAPWGAKSVHSLVETSDGSLAAATAELGFFLASPDQPGEWKHFCRAQGFCSDWIVSLCEDHEGGVWMGTGGAGLSLLRRRTVETLCPPDQWQGRVVLSVSPGRDGSFWVGTEGAGLYHYRQGKWENYGSQQNLHPYIWSAVEDPEGTVWIGTWGGGLFTLRDGQVQPVTIPGPPLPAISSIVCSREGGLWVATEAGLVRYKDGVPTWFRQTSAGLPLRRIRAIVEDKSGGVWFGSVGSGLGHLSPGELRHYGSRDGFATDFVESLYLEPDGVLWIGTQGAGLWRLKQGRFASVDKRQGLFNARISDIQLDDEGFLWLSSRDGIMCARKAELEDCLDGKTNEVHCAAYGPWDGMPTATCSGRLQPAGCRTPDGKMWFPTTKGLVIVEPRRTGARPLPPPVVIERLSVDDQTVAEGAALRHLTRLSPGRHRLQFEYTGLSFVASERMRFKYRIEGLESQWVDAGHGRTANYSHVPPGSYLFRVIACNRDGVWNQTGAVAAFVIAPYFWQTWWCRLVGVVSLVFAGGGIVWFDSRRRMRRKLEQSERQRAVEHERARIARDIHDDLGAHLTRITMLSESARGQLARPEQVAAGLSRIYDTARDLTRSMDEIVWAINPRHDTLEGLASYFERFALDFLGSAGIGCQLDFPLQFPDWPLTSEIRHNLFLAFKEALNNIVKHAHATEVTLSIHTHGTEFELAISDNGCGFVPGEVAGRKTTDRFSAGNGLENLQRRLEKSGGVCLVSSTPGQGTRIVFRFPVR